MKRIFIISAMSLVLMAATGCYHREYHSFLHNESGQTVTVSYKYSNEHRSYTLTPKQVVEIPEAEQWSITSMPVQDTVTFEYADGTVVLHTCRQEIYEDGTGMYIFTPSENNILQDDINKTSWILSDPHHHNEMNKDYYIK